MWVGGEEFSSFFVCRLTSNLLGWLLDSSASTFRVNNNFKFTADIIK